MKKGRGVVVAYRDASEAWVPVEPSNVVELPATQREVNGKLSFDELSDFWGRVYDVLEPLSEELAAKGLTTREIREVIVRAVENHENHSMVIEGDDSGV
jgi:hypothetical protein